MIRALVALFGVVVVVGVFVGAESATSHPPSCAAVPYAKCMAAYRENADREEERLERDKITGEWNFGPLCRIAREARSCLNASLACSANDPSNFVMTRDLMKLVELKEQFWCGRKKFIR